MVAYKGRRGLHNPELEFGGNNELTDGLCRVVKLSCTFLLFWAKKLGLLIIIILVIKYNLILLSLSLNFVYLVDLKNW